LEEYSLNLISAPRVLIYSNTIFATRAIMKSIFAILTADWNTPAGPIKY